MANDYHITAATPPNDTNRGNVANAYYIGAGLIGGDVLPVTSNEKLAFLEWCIPWESGLPVTSVAFDRRDKQQLLWGYPDILWGGGVVPYYYTNLLAGRMN